MPELASTRQVLVRAACEARALALPLLRSYTAPMDKVTLHVRLLGERSDIWRPVNGVFQGDGKFEITGPEQPEDEQWEFPVGAVVRCEPKAFNNGKTGFSVVALAD